MESAPRPLARELLRAVLGARDAADRDLLARFVRSRDEDAFAELVRRHGRMVLAVGRRVTGHAQDAEDAFQAAFLVLARRAGQLKQPDQLANWLYGVAYRTALEARTARRRLEHVVSSLPEPPAPTAPDDTADLRRVIDEELARLPDKYRSAVVLCDLEGVSRAEAAARLKVPEGTLSSRLAYARKVLAGRLARRGIGSSAGAIAVALAREAMGNAVPAGLLQVTARAAVRAAAGAVLPADLVSPSVSSITDGVLKTMLAHRLRSMIGAALACGLLGLSAYGLAQVPAGADPGYPPLDDPVPPMSFDPFVDRGIAAQPKTEKIVAKGIEDEDVPLTATPSQAVVRMEEGMLIVRQRSSGYRAVTALRGNQPVTSYQMKTGVNAAKYDAGDVVVFDMKGNRLLPKTWKEKLKNDVHVLIGFDGKLPNPRELTLFRDDTLLVVLTAPQAGAANSGVAGMAPPMTGYAPSAATQPELVPPLSNALPTPTNPGSYRPAPRLPQPGLPTSPPDTPTSPASPPTAPPNRSTAPPMDDLPPSSRS